MHLSVLKPCDHFDSHDFCHPTQVFLMLDAGNTVLRRGLLLATLTQSSRKAAA